jgi:hypothetical protein
LRSHPPISIFSKNTASNFKRGILSALFLIPFLAFTRSAESSVDFSALTGILEKCCAGDACRADCLDKNEAGLEELITRISLLEEGEYRSWSREAKIAFWANSVFIWTLRLQAGLKVGGAADLNRPPFSNHRLFVLGKPFSAGEMEEEMLAEFKDERLLFLMNDEAWRRGTLMKRPLEPGGVEGVLNGVTDRYVRDPRHVTLKRKELWLSPFLKKVAPYCLFNYGGSEPGKKKKKFTREELALLTFLFHHAGNEETRSALEQFNYKIRYRPEKS